MKLADAKVIIQQREEAAKATLAGATSGDHDDEFEDEPTYNDDDFDSAVKLIRDMAFAIQETTKLVVMHPHRKTTLEKLANDAMFFVCMFEAATEKQEDKIIKGGLCTLCNGVPFSGDCTGDCIDYSG